MNEIYRTVYGFKLGKYYFGYLTDDEEGSPCQVSFDAEKVLANRHNLIGFYHTHPNMTARPSALDQQTMEAWTDCLGMNLLCAIEGVDGLYGWWYEKDVHFKYMKCKKFGRIIVGEVL